MRWHTLWDNPNVPLEGDTLWKATLEHTNCIQFKLESHCNKVLFHTKLQPHQQFIHNSLRHFAKNKDGFCNKESITAVNAPRNYRDQWQVWVLLWTMNDKHSWAWNKASQMWGTCHCSAKYRNMSGHTWLIFLRKTATAKLDLVGEKKGEKVQTNRNSTLGSVFSVLFLQPSSGTQKFQPYGVHEMTFQLNAIEQYLCNIPLPS